MRWLELALLALRLAHDFARWVEQERIADAAEKKILKQHRERIDAALTKAEAARARVRGEFAADPGRLRDDDGFKRED